MIEIQRYANFYKAYSIYMLKHHPNEDESASNQATAKTLNDVLIYVLDKSGSMSGSRITNLKAAVIDLTGKVRDSFKSIHYIAFDNDAKEISYEQVGRLNASGGTSFDNANEKMFECINKYPEGVCFTVIYFTDGEGTVNFGKLKQTLNSLNQKDVIFHTIGFSSEANKTLLVELTQSGSTFGTFKSIVTSADIKFDEFEFLFNESKRGMMEFENNFTQYFVLDSSNQACSFILNENEDVKMNLKKCILNNSEQKFEITERKLNEIEQVEERLKLLESFFNFVLLKKIHDNTNKDEIVKLFTEYKLFIECQTIEKINQHSSILDIETLNEEFNDLIQTINSYIQEAKKQNSNFIELKSLTYDKISKQKFSRRLDQRAAKNELKFQSNFKKMKELVDSNIEVINQLNENDFVDYCYLTQQNYKDLLKNHDCLGICLSMTRGGEVVIVDPNFIKINNIGYSSFVSLNSMFMALKYCLDRNQSEQEMINVHGGFVKNFQSYFLDGTHRAQYNAMVPLYINEFHWKIARLLLEPLFGYLVTLNIDGYASDQYYTLYFLVLEKIIHDMLDNKNSEAIQRIYEQVKLCCQNVLKEFYILKPNVASFIDDRLKRTKDIWPNLASYLLYISFFEDELSDARKNFNEFEYAYFEEHMRRYLVSEFKKDETFQLFKLDTISIQNLAVSIFNSDDAEANTKIALLDNEELVELLSGKTNVNLIDDNEMFLSESVERLNKFFDKFAKFRFTKLFNYVFNCETDFFKKYKEQAVALIYQILTYGSENDKWRSYRNYTSFEHKYENQHKTFLRKEYLNLICMEFKKEFGKLCGNLNNQLAEFTGNKYLNCENYEAYTFFIGDLTFSVTKKLLQSTSVAAIKGHEFLERIFHFIFNSFESRSNSSHWIGSKKNTFRFFKVLYLTERRENLKGKRDFSELNSHTIDALIKYFKHNSNGNVINEETIRKLYSEHGGKDLATNDKFIVLKYPLSWEILILKYDFSRALYLFGQYRFILDREFGPVQITDYHNPDNAAELEHFFNKTSKPIVASVPVKQKVKIYEDFVRPYNSKSLIDLEKEWINEQLSLKTRNILTDTEDWQSDFNKLKFIAVLDLICDKNDNSTCAAGIMVFELKHDASKLELVEAALLRTKLTEPYVSGLLAFREAFAYQELLKKISIKPQLLIFDGNGLLHKREFGLASHIGVVENFPSIGFAKKLHLVDSFPYKTLPEFKQYYQPLLKNFQDYCELKTIDNKILGYAYLSGENTIDPVFISPGHKISLATTINIVKLIDNYLMNMNKSTRESIVGYVDKMTRRNLNKTDDDDLDQYF